MEFDIDGSETFSVSRGAKNATLGSTAGKAWKVTWLAGHMYPSFHVDGRSDALRVDCGRRTRDMGGVIVTVSVCPTSDDQWRYSTASRRWVRVLCDGEGGDVLAVFDGDDTPRTPGGGAFLTDVEYLTREVRGHLEDLQLGGGGAVDDAAIARALQGAGFDVEQAMAQLTTDVYDAAAGGGAEERDVDVADPALDALCAAQPSGGERRQASGRKRARAGTSVTTRSSTRARRTGGTGSGTCSGAGDLTPDEIRERNSIYSVTRTARTSVAAAPSASVRVALETIEDAEEAVAADPPNSSNRRALASALKAQAAHVRILALLPGARDAVSPRAPQVSLRHVCGPGGLDVLGDDVVAVAGVPLRVHNVTLTELCFTYARRAHGALEPALLCQCADRAHQPCAAQGVTEGGSTLQCVLRHFAARLGLVRSGCDPSREVLTLLFVAAAVLKEPAAHRVDCRDVERWVNTTIIDTGLPSDVV